MGSEFICRSSAIIEKLKWMSGEETKEPNSKSPQVFAATDEDSDHAAQNEVDGAELDSALEQVDELLAEEDPTFLSKMLEISGDKNINASNIEVADPVAKPEFSLFLRIMFFVLPGSKYLFLTQRRWRAQLRIWRMSQKSFKELIKELGFAAWVNCKRLAQTSFAKIKYFIFYFRALSGKGKILLISLILFSGASLYLIYYTYKKGILPEEKDPFVGSLAEVSSAVYRYDPQNGREFFYDSLRVAQNLMFLPKTVVNIKPTSRSGSNPMMAFEIFLEGTTSEVMVEFKDREPEMKDIIQRQAEEMSYDQMESQDGKRLLTRKLRIAVNTVLTTGRIKNIYYKTFVLKR